MTALYMGGAEERRDAEILYDNGFTHLYISARRTIRKYKKLKFNKRLEHFTRFKGMFESVLVEYDDWYDIVSELEDYVDIVAYPHTLENSFANVPHYQKCPILDKWDFKYSDLRQIGIYKSLTNAEKLSISKKAHSFGLKVYGGSVGTKPNDVWDYQYDMVKSSSWLHTRTYGLRVIFHQDRLRTFGKTQQDYGLTRANCIKYDVDYDSVVKSKGALPKELMDNLQNMTLGAYKEWMTYLSNR
jgi:hypothetical protein